ncbi:hypothetical protein CAPTEDRAFT_220150 [Capitella teleta]|uniref:EF-hand domain-containing protein n=1 Tax=Capitella teleta TaxID=283909 RepID=R7UKQ8_CAPTE|nr:hypothetical protein CAPTEDRAFT_220150 [Capitella teleta]|eukprot:ELU06678.1 hypothetical protein CAPTEDRAFT_220150 [Capitella teleta]
MEQQTERRRLSLKTSTEIFTVFTKYDTDRNGLISQNEAHQVLREELGYLPRQTQALFKACDTNGDKQLSLGEFVKFYFCVQKELEDMEMHFNHFDANKDGRISTEEILDALRQAPLAIREDEVEDMIRVHDANGDGYLQWDEFVKFWNFLK